MKKIFPLLYGDVLLEYNNNYAVLRNKKCFYSNLDFIYVDGLVAVDSFSIHVLLAAVLNTLKYCGNASQTHP